ncbi:MAG: hypothetical protein ACRDH2_15230, partial [Anaerolineales bacterium]
VFNNRYAEISSEMIPALERYKNFRKKVNEQEVAGLWTANNDARNYVVLGDPAARLKVGDESTAQAERPVIQLSSRPPEAAATVTVTTTTTVAAPAAQGSAASAAASTDFGLMDTFKQTQASVGSALQQFTEKLGAFMSKAIEEATTLEIATYVSEDLSHVQFENGHFTGARLRALTRISVDGDTQICVPEKDGEVDTALWAIHTEMMKQAQESRAELLKTLVSAATNMLSVWKP